MKPPRIGTNDETFGDVQPSTAVIESVSERTATDPVDLPPLYESIDPDALNALFETTASGTVRRGRIEFTYAGCSVVVSSSDGITVESCHEKATGGVPGWGLSVE